MLVVELSELVSIASADVDVSEVSLGFCLGAGVSDGTANIVELLELELESSPPRRVL